MKLSKQNPNDAISTHLQVEKENFSLYQKKIRREAWDEFRKKLDPWLTELSSHPDQFRIEEVDIYERWKDQKDQPNSFVSKIEGVTLKGVEVITPPGNTPTLGVGEVSYKKNEGFNQKLFTNAPTSISFFESPVGGIIVTIRQPQTEGLLKNTPELIVYANFRDKTKIKASEIDRAFNFFLMCAQERPIYGSFTHRGQIWYQWVLNYKNRKIKKTMSMLEKAISILT